MPALNDNRLEAFAYLLAVGWSPMKAACECGFKRASGPAIKRAANKKVAARVKEIRHERARGYSKDIGPLITMMVDCAEAAKAKDTVQGLNLARRCLLDAAELKGRLTDPVIPRAELRF
ncbi:MAG: hypothetical protein ACREEB_09820 [Caulobacteraceae bacterium]